MSPSEIKCPRDQVAMKTITHQLKEYWMLIQHDGAVILVKQRTGEPPDSEIIIPRVAFQKLLDWYLKDQVLA